MEKEKIGLTYDDVRKKFETIKLALGTPPYTTEQVGSLFGMPGTSFQSTGDETASNAREAIAWLAGDFVQNWITAINKRESA